MRRHCISDDTRCRLVQVRHITYDLKVACHDISEEYLEKKCDMILNVLDEVIG